MAGIVQYGAAGSLAENINSATLSLVAPVVVMGDLMIAAVHSHDNTTWTIPSGWSMLGAQHNNTANQTVLVAYKVAGSADSGATFNFVKSANNSLLSCGLIFTHLNPNPGNPIDPAGIVFNDMAVANETITWGDYTNAQGFARLCFLSFYDLGATTLASPSVPTMDSSATIRIDAEATLGQTATISLFTGTNTSSHATGQATAASGSTVDAISVAAVFSISIGRSSGGVAGGGFGISTGPSRGGRGEDRGFGPRRSA